MAKAIVVAAPSSGSGKTLITLGLLRAFRNRGLRVASAKVGPDYIDPRFHEAATGRPCFNLDPWAMRRRHRSHASRRISAGDADIVIIEGRHGPVRRAARREGLDRRPGPHAWACPCSSPSTAATRRQSVAALVHGFSTFRPDLTVAGVFLNRVASDRHEAMLRERARRHTVLGALRHDDSLALPIPPPRAGAGQENQDLETSSKLPPQPLHVKQFLTGFSRLPRQPVGESAIRRSAAALGPTIAVARDAAFAFAYPHLLTAGSRRGQASPSSRLWQTKPPNPTPMPSSCPAAIPNSMPARLAGKCRFLAGLRTSSGPRLWRVRRLHGAGRSLTDARGTSHAMAGLLPVSTSFATRKLHLGYRRLTPATRSAMDVAAARPRIPLLDHCPAKAPPTGSSRQGMQPDEILPPMGLRRGKVMGSYAHVICEAQ